VIYYVIVAVLTVMAGFLLGIWLMCLLFLDDLQALEDIAHTAYQFMLERKEEPDTATGKALLELTTRYKENKED